MVSLVAEPNPATAAELHHLRAANRRQAPELGIKKSIAITCFERRLTQPEPP